MDLVCPRCGEPWDIDSVYHDNDRDDLTPDQAAKVFRAEGRGLFGIKCEPRRTDATAAAGALYDLLGDDMDGAAAMLEDLGL